MKKRLSAILLACGLSASMMSGTAFAASSGTDSSEAAVLEQAATEAEAEESELAADTTGGQETEAAAKDPRNITGDRVYAQVYATIEQSIEQTLAQLSTFTDEQVEQYMNSTDESVEHLVAAWDQVRDQVGEYEGVDYYDVDEDGTTVTFTDAVKYSKAEEDKSKVTVTVTVDMKAQSMSYSWNVKETIGKAMGEAAENTVVGLINVFFILFILTFVISLFRFIPNGSRKKKELEAAEAAAPVTPDVPEEAEQEGASDDGEIAAVIAAAVAAYESETGKKPADGFVVRSIRRRGRRNNWQNV